MQKYEQIETHMRLEKTTSILENSLLDVDISKENDYVCLCPMQVIISNMMLLMMDEHIW